MWFLDRRLAILFAIGVSGVLLLCGIVPKAEAQAEKCKGRNYPVIVYDASTRRAFIVSRSDVLAMQLAPMAPLNNYVMPVGVLPDRFLCDGRPVEVWIANRRLKTTFTVSLSTVFAAPAPTLDLRGLATAASAGTATTTPGSKGFISNSATSTNTIAGLLTTDQAVALFLNDETFEKAYTRVTDDALDVMAQSTQLQANIAAYTATLNLFLGVNADGRNRTPLDNASLLGITASWNLLAASIAPAVPPAPAIPVTEVAFDDWTSRADRLQTEVQRLNAKMQAYPIADTLTNLQASATVLRANYNDVLSERDAIIRAVQLLTGLPTVPPPPPGQPASYWRARQTAEIRLYLRAHYTGTTISEATLARIVDSYLGVGPGDPRPPRGLMSLAGYQICPPPPLPIGASQVQVRYCSALATLTPPPTSAAIALIAAPGGALNSLMNQVTLLNSSEGYALRKINNVYDNYYAAIEPINLNLNGNAGNLYVFYTITAAEQFHRYQIITDLPVPQSNCVLSSSVNTSTSGGVTVCTAAASPAPPGPLATYASTMFPPGVTPSPTGYADFNGRFEVHHFSDGTLVTGVAYDSVANRTLSWNACAATNTACLFPVAATSTTPATTAPGYQLISSSQAPVAAVEGVDIFFHRKDQFPTAPQLSTGFLIGVSAYPLNHYFFGPIVDRRGFNLSGGVAIGSTNVLPDNFGYSLGAYSATNPTIPSASRFKVGFFVMFGFDTNLFQAIFTGSAFQNIQSVTTAGSSSLSPASAASTATAATNAAAAAPSTSTSSSGTTVPTTPQ